MIWYILYIYIPVIIPVRRWSQWGGLGWGGVGWGGVGMMTFLAHEHIFDATENWGGVGWGWWRSLHMNTSLVLRRTGVGWGGSLAFGFYNLFFKKSASCIDNRYFVFILTFFWVMFLLVAGAAGHILSAVAAAGTCFFKLEMSRCGICRTQTLVCFWELKYPYVILWQWQSCERFRWPCFPAVLGRRNWGVSGPAYVFILTCASCLINKHKWEWRHGFCILFTRYLYILVRLTQLLTLSFTRPGWFPISSRWLWHWWYGRETTCRTIRTCDGVSEKANSYWERRRRTCKVETQAWERQGQRRTRKRNNVRRQCSS